MRFSYDGIDGAFLARIMDETSRRLSRTRGGVSDTSASEEKHPLLLNGEALRRQAAENERRVAQWIMDTRSDPPPADPAAVRQQLFVLADLTNTGLLPAGRLRTWEVPYPLRLPDDDGHQPSPNRRIPPAELPGAIDAFCGTIHRRWGELSGDPAPLAAWAEWHLNPGPLHPFYDGCGRVSRSFAAMLLVRASSLPPLYGSRETYFEQAERGPTAFADYLRNCIADCAQWLGLEHSR
jgi:hypothetical protein